MTLDYKGIEINFTESGKGETIVFLHGFLENSNMWKGIIDSLSEQYHCMAIDLLGHGKTDCLGYVHTMEMMAETVNAVLTSLDISNATIIGHSMGGYVSLALTEIYPNKVGQVVLLNSTSYADSQERKLNRDRAIGLIKKEAKTFISMAITNLFAEQNRAAFLEQISEIKSEAMNTSVQGVISAIEGMKIRKDRREVLKKFVGSKSIIAGRKDSVLSFEQSVEEASFCKTKLIALEGGHMSFIENQEELIELLKNHLSKYE